MYTGINLMLPTRGRVKNGKLPRHIQSFVRNAANPKNIYYSILVDAGDEETGEYLRTTADFGDAHFQFLINSEPKPHLGKFFNRIYRDSFFKDPTNLVSMIGDDMVCETFGWDEAILHWANRIEGWGIIHCEDGIQHGKIAVNMFTSRKWIDAIGGEFMCELFPADFIDTIHTEVARRTQNEYFLPNIILRHEHSSQQHPKDRDETFTRLRAEWNGESADVLAQAYIKTRLNYFFKSLEAK